MKLSLNANVYSLDGHYGRLTHTILHPQTKIITHIAVKEYHQKTYPLVPIEHIETCVPDCVVLSCTPEELGEMPPFIKKTFIELDRKRLVFEQRAEALLEYDVPYIAFPFVFPKSGYVEEKNEKAIPYGELAVRRGAKVRANNDKVVGTVDEFLVADGDDQISHIIMREDHLWDHQEVTIPVSAIKRIDDDMIHLLINPDEIEALPHIPVHRWWD